uniref:Uncharacterized protein n=1 Tax=Arundo donax TaxID=35708 RepID=A0A0A9DI53_ARUDO
MTSTLMFFYVPRPRRCTHRRRRNCRQMSPRTCRTSPSPSPPAPPLPRSSSLPPSSIWGSGGCGGGRERRKARGLPSGRRRWRSPSRPPPRTAGATGARRPAPAGRPGGSNRRPRASPARRRSCRSPRIGDPPAGRGP